MEAVIGMFMIWLLFAIGSAVVASNRGASGAGWFFAGLFLGPLGFALAFTKGRKCPSCDSRISTKAKVCPKCQVPLETQKTEKRSQPWKPKTPLS